MTSETPFYLAKVECPVCKTINEFETIKVGAYTENGRDTDFCPNDITWRNPRYQSYNPLLYFTATCESCFYTREYTKSYKDWKNDSYFKTYRQKAIKDQHLNLLSKPDSVIREVGEKLDSSRYPNETALLKLTLAVIDETLNDKPSNLDLGRYYLRIGWLYRDMERGENPNQQNLKVHLISIENKINTLKASLNDVNTNLYDVDHAITQEFEDNKIASELKSILLPIRDKYDTELKSFNETLKQLIGKIDDLEIINQEHKKAALGGDFDEHTPSYFEYKSFFEFLTAMAEKNKEIVLNEKEALTKAVEYYKLAFSEGREIAQGNQQIQASYLIAELSRRIGQSEQAKEYFNTTIRNGQELVYRHKGDRSRTALARKILELAIEQARENRAATEAI
ncbi:MAG TPA: DUF2225 domain-containing protein [candidate division Zixibacteria bacterium]|nr:DUF2225 domain-containing protein [candidate division Zixibacteria bacterium]